MRHSGVLARDVCRCPRLRSKRNKQTHTPASLENIASDVFDLKLSSLFNFLDSFISELYIISPRKL